MPPRHGRQCNNGPNVFHGGSTTVVTPMYYGGGFCTPTAPVPSIPVRGEVAPSPITTTNASLTGDSLLDDLRRRALSAALGGGQAFSSIMPEIRNRLGSSLATDPDSVNFRVHTSASAIESNLNGISPMVAIRNGLTGEFNRVVTFSVPATTGNVSLNAYYFDEPRPVTGGWNCNSFFSPHAPRTHRQRLSSLYEVHVRREGDQLHYTVALTHAFVGGLRIGVGGRNFLVMSHETPPAHTPPPAVVRRETPASDQIVTRPPPPPVLDDPPALDPLVSNDSASATLVQPPVNSTENGGTVGPTPGVRREPPPSVVIVAQPLSPPRIQDSSEVDTPLQSSVVAGNHQNHVSPPTVIALAGPPVSESNQPDRQLTYSPPPPPPVDERDASPGDIVSNLLASLPQVHIGPGWMSFSAIPLPPLPPQRRSDRVDTASVPSTILPEGDDLPLVDSGGGGGAGGTSVVTLPPDSPRINHTGPVVRARTAWEGLTLNLPRFVPQTIDTSTENRIRAQYLTALSLFSLYQWSGDIDEISNRLGSNRNADTLCEEYVHHSYYLPQHAFQTLARFLRAADDRDNDSTLTRDRLSGAITGLAENPDSGTRWGLETRMTRIQSFLSDHPTLGREAADSLRVLRGRMLGISRPLFWTTLYAYQRQVEDAEAGNAAAPERLDAVVRRTAHHPVTVQLQTTFNTIFGTNPPVSHHVFDTYIRNLRARDPNQVESVHNLSAQDVLAMRNLITAAKEARTNPAFIAHFTAARTEAMQAALVARLAPNGDNPPSPAAVEAYLRETFGNPTVAANRTEILRLVGTLSTNNTPTRRAEVAAAILQPFASQMQFGDTQLRALDAAITHMEGYVTRTRTLLRAQAVGDNTDHAVGAFLALLPDVDGSPNAGKERPTNEDFETRLTAALNALESEYALLGGDQVGGAYATQRRGVLLRLHQDLRRHLMEERGPWRAYLAGNGTRTALRGRVDRATPASATAATLPTDEIDILDGLNDIMRRGIGGVTPSSAMRSIQRFLSR